MENNKKRTLVDRLISSRNAMWFSLTEPLKLRIARYKYERYYQQDRYNHPLVTVYIPTYNRAELLMERSVPSVLDQTYDNFELLIIGDHCTDKTEELLNDINDTRIRFYNIPERGYRYPPTAENHWLAGPVVAANTALSMAKGKWIARIDDDDTWTPDHIESLLDFAQKGDYEFVSAQYEEIRHGKRRIDKGVGALDPYYTRKEKSVKGYNPLIGGTSTWLYRSYLRFIRYDINCWRKAWNRVNDVDLSQRIFKAGVRMGFLDKLLAFVHPRPGEEAVGLEAYLIAEEKGVLVHG